MVNLTHFLACTGTYCINASKSGIPTSTSNLSSAVSNFTNLGLFLLGALSVIFMVVGGLQYIFSGGNPQRTSQARETILYAAIGLVIASAAYAIVTFIIAMLPACTTNCTSSSLNNSIAAITNIILYIAGAGSIIMVVIGGLRYTISGGNPSAVNDAKNTILFAVIGLVISVSAYALVNYVLGAFHI
jgi:uncharacterized membrane protein (DUF373 family)